MRKNTKIMLAEKLFAGFKNIQNCFYQYEPLHELSENCSIKHDFFPNALHNINNNSHII